MSESDKERSDVGVDGGGGGGCSGDDDEDSGGLNRRDEQKKQSGHGGEGCAKKGKRVTLFRFRKGKKQLHGRNNRRSSANSGCFGKRVGGGGGGGGSCLCLKQPQTLDSPVESQTSDPNSSEFTHELLRALIEKNDFHSKECNPHLDTDNLSPSCAHIN